jgi:SpoVK/Ycf46/Vps4 family AAA+-type ATPase
MKRYFENENVIIVLEELTERLERGSEDMLNFLDGHYSWTNCYVFGTTNYPENLPDNIVNRPGRFNELIEFPNATEEQKLIYLRAKGFDDKDIDYVMPKLKDYTLDYITQLAIRSKINKEPLGVYLKVLEANREKIKRSFKKNSGKVGLI